MPRTVLAIVLAWLCAFAHAQDLQPIPPLTQPVIDTSGTLDAIELAGLRDKLLAIEKEKGSQVAILMVATTKPEDIASFANRVGNSWKIGRKDVGDGVLVIVAKDDRRVRIEVAKSLEGAIPDLAARQIIEESIQPNFRQGQYAAGLREAVDKLAARIGAEALPAPKAPRRDAGGFGFDWTDLLVLMFIAVPIVGALLRGMMGRTFGSLVTGGGMGAIALFLTSSLFVAAIAAFIALVFSLFSGGGGGGLSRRGGFGGPIIWGGGSGGGGWSGGGGSFGGGGWGGSGGGGDFGGGGASGDW